MSISRRDLLALGCRSALGLGLTAWFADDLVAGDAEPSPVATTTNLIYLHMAGGMSHLDTLDPKPGQDVMGGVQALASKVDGVQLSALLPELAARLDRCALIRSMTSTQGAHEQGDYFMRTGYQMRGTIRHPTLGAWISRLVATTPGNLPAYVVIGDGAHPGSGFMGQAQAPLPVDDPTAGLQYSSRNKNVDAARAGHRIDLLTALESVGAPAATAAAAMATARSDALKLMDSKDLLAFDLKLEKEATRERYGEDRFAQGCLMARRLVEHGVRAVDVTLGGWDTHDDHLDRVTDRCAILDRALPALLDDLRERGMDKTTLVVLGSEFGRTPVFNVRQGRDHFPKVFSVVMSGAGVPGGMVVGASDERAMTVAARQVTIPDLHATIAARLGLARTIPVHSPEGRPFVVGDKGVAVSELV